MDVDHGADGGRVDLVRAEPLEDSQYPGLFRTRWTLVGKDAGHTLGEDVVADLGQLLAGAAVEQGGQSQGHTKDRHLRALAGLEQQLPF